MGSRILIVANPIAGRGHATRRASALAAALDRRGFATTVRATCDTDGSSREDHAAIIVCGGDGTLNAALDAVPSASLPFGLLPAGTTNTLASALRLPRGADACAAVIARGVTLRIPIGRCNGRRFLTVVGAGFDGAMAAEVADGRRGRLGWLRMIPPVLRVAWRWPRHELTVTLDDGSVHPDLTQVIVTRVGSYGRFLKLPVRSTDDEAWHVFFSADRGRARWIRKLWRAWRGRLRDDRDFVYRRSRVVHIEATRPVPFHADGESHGTTPIDIRLSGEHLNLLVPEEATL